MYELGFILPYVVLIWIIVALVKSKMKDKEIEDIVKGKYKKH